MAMAAKQSRIWSFIKHFLKRPREVRGMSELYSHLDVIVKTTQKSGLFVVFLSIRLYLANVNQTTSNSISRLTVKASQAIGHQQRRCLALGNDTASKNLAAKVVAP